jgi:transposase
MPQFKFRVVMEILSGTKAIGQIARSYRVHPLTLTHWKKEFIKKGPGIFSQQTTIQEYEKRIEELERLIGHKEVEIVLLKNFLAETSPRGKKLSLRRCSRANMG